MEDKCRNDEEESRSSEVVGGHYKREDMAKEEEVETERKCGERESMLYTRVILVVTRLNRRE